MYVYDDVRVDVHVDTDCDDVRVDVHVDTDWMFL